MLSLVSIVIRVQVHARCRRRGRARCWSKSRRWSTIRILRNHVVWWLVTDRITRLLPSGIAPACTRAAFDQDAVNGRRKGASFPSRQIWRYCWRSCHRCAIGPCRKSSLCSARWGWPARCDRYSAGRKGCVRRPSSDLPTPSFRSRTDPNKA